MKIGTLKVDDLFSVLSAPGIERQLRLVAGVSRALVNPVSGTTMIWYDPGKTSLTAVRAAIEDCGFHCSGEAVPRHLCDDPTMPRRVHPVSPISQGTLVQSGPHSGHADIAPATTIPAAPMVDHKAHGSGRSDAMAREMGHGGGMDMQAMVRDMRNRFWIAL
ncbi:MAG: heavy-metal-associated domain-containing protein, partial [Reyranella sp.]|nr:heavy-metal-associated domain-containing protein [Reyranella sp.]